jgi:hypothetical protein
MISKTPPCNLRRLRPTLSSMRPQSLYKGVRNSSVCASCIKQHVGRVIEQVNRGGGSLPPFDPPYGGQHEPDGSDDGGKEVNVLPTYLALLLSVIITCLYCPEPAFATTTSSVDQTESGATHNLQGSSPLTR